MSSSLSTLPNDILHHISSYLDGKSILVLRTASKPFSDPTFDRIAVQRFVTRLSFRFNQSGFISNSIRNINSIPIDLITTFTSLQTFELELKNEDLHRRHSVPFSIKTSTLPKSLTVLTIKTALGEVICDELPPKLVSLTIASANELTTSFFAIMPNSLTQVCVDVEFDPKQQFPDLSKLPIMDLQLGPCMTSSALLKLPEHLEKLRLYNAYHLSHESSVSFQFNYLTSLFLPITIRDPIWAALLPSTLTTLSSSVEIFVAPGNVASVTLYSAIAMMRPNNLLWPSQLSKLERLILGVPPGEIFGFPKLPYQSLTSLEILKSVMSSAYLSYDCWEGPIPEADWLPRALTRLDCRLHSKLLHCLPLGITSLSLNDVESPECALIPATIFCSLLSLRLDQDFCPQHLSQFSPLVPSLEHLEVHNLIFDEYDPRLFHWPQKLRSLHIAGNSSFTPTNLGKLPSTLTRLINRNNTHLVPPFPSVRPGLVIYGSSYVPEPVSELPIQSEPLRAPAATNKRVSAATPEPSSKSKGACVIS